MDFKLDLNTEEMSKIESVINFACKTFIDKAVSDEIKKFINNNTKSILSNVIREYTKEIRETLDADYNDQIKNLKEKITTEKLSSICNRLIEKTHKLTKISQQDGSDITLLKEDLLSLKILTQILIEDNVNHYNIIGNEIMGFKENMDKIIERTHKKFTEVFKNTKTPKQIEDMINRNIYIYSHAYDNTNHKTKQ